MEKFKEMRKFIVCGAGAQMRAFLKICFFFFNYYLDLKRKQSSPLFIQSVTGRQTVAAVGVFALTAQSGRE